MRKFAKLFILLVCAVALQCNAQTNTFTVTSEDKAFFEQIKKAMASNDVDWISSVVSYPITIKEDGGKKTKVRNQSDFKKQSSKILTDRVKSAVEKQSPESLFKNWQGMRAGKGELWFSAVSSESEKPDRWVYRIIAINASEIPSKSNKR